MAGLIDLISTGLEDLEQDRLKEAELCFSKALQLSSTDEDRQEVLRCLLKLTGKYLRQGEFEKPELLYRHLQTLEILERTRAMEWLARVLQQNQFLTRAEQMYVEIYELRANFLGTSHADSVGALRTAALLRQMQGKSAEDLYERAFEIASARKAAMKEAVGEQPALPKNEMRKPQENKAESGESTASTASDEPSAASIIDEMIPLKRPYAHALSPSKSPEQESAGTLSVLSAIDAILAQDGELPEPSSLSKQKSSAPPSEPAVDQVSSVQNAPSLGHEPEPSPSQGATAGQPASDLSQTLLPPSPSSFEIVKGEPGSLAPAASDPVAPAPAPAPALPQPVLEGENPQELAESAQAESAQEESAQAESAQEESAQEESAQEESAQEESAQEESLQEESLQEESAQAESLQAKVAEARKQTKKSTLFLLDQVLLTQARTEEQNEVPVEEFPDLAQSQLTLTESVQELMVQWEPYCNMISRQLVKLLQNSSTPAYRKILLNLRSLLTQSDTVMHVDVEHPFIGCKRTPQSNNLDWQILKELSPVYEAYDGTWGTYPFEIGMIYACLRRALQLGPFHVDTLQSLHRLAHIYIHEMFGCYDLEFAAATFRVCVLAFNDHPEFDEFTRVQCKTSLANVLMAKNEAREAKEVLKATIKSVDLLDQGNRQQILAILKVLAECTFQLGDYETAAGVYERIRNFQEAVSRDGELFDTLIHLIDCYRRSSNTSQLQSYIQRLEWELDWFDDQGPICETIALKALDLEIYEVAEKFLNRILQLKKPTEEIAGRAASLLIRIYERTGRNEMAQRLRGM